MESNYPGGRPLRKFEKRQPEAAVGGLALLRTGDKVRVDLRNRRVDLIASDDELAASTESRLKAELEVDWAELRDAVYRFHVP